MPPTQITLDSDIQTEHRPISTFNNSGSTIDFEIHTAIDEYINLGKSELYMCLKINLSKRNLAKDQDIKVEDWKKIAPVNYLLHSMFKQIKAFRLLY